MLAAILAGYLVALLAPLLVRILRSASGAIIAIVPAFLFAYFLQFVPEAAQGHPWRFAYPWGGAGGLSAAFFCDSLGLLFALLITLSAAAASLATAGLALSDRARVRLLFALMGLMASALGLVLAETPVLLMSFAVLSSLFAYLALTARRGAAARCAGIPVLIALLAGDAALIAALTWLSLPAGDTLVALTHHSLMGNAADVAAGVLLLISGFARFILLPAELGAPGSRAMAEPAALLANGAAYLPLSIYLMVRFEPMLAGAHAARIIIGLFGAVLLVIGAITGFRAARLRTLFAAVTSISLAMAFLELAMPSGGGTVPALLITLAHGLGLGALLLAQQALGGETSERGALIIDGRDRASSIGLLILGGAALVGAVPSLGMLGLATALGAGLGASSNPANAAFMTIGEALLIAVLLRMIRAMRRAPADEPRTSAAPSLAALFGGFALCAILMMLGWHPAVLKTLFLDHIHATGAAPALGAPWPHGLALPLAGGAVILAAALWWFENDVRAALEWLSRGLPPHPQKIWRGAVPLAQRGGHAGISALRHFGYDRIAGLVASVLCAVLAWFAVVAIGGGLKPLPHIAVLPTAAIASVGAIGALLTLFQRDREGALTLLSMTGVLAALTMLAVGVVDLAYLMLLVLVIETAILLILAPRVVARAAPQSRAPLRKAGRMMLAIAAGLGCALVALTVPHEASPIAWAPIDQFQLLLAILTGLLVLGVIVSELNLRRMSGGA